nr:hypothetical protein [Tanacetum cinerariifolium]
KAAKERVMSRYANIVVGYFVGKSLAFKIIENYTKNTWAKFGLSKLMKTDDGVYLFKFNTKRGMDQVIERGPWLIRNTPLILSKWAPNVSLKPGEVSKVPGRISFARALIEVCADSELKKEVRIAVSIDEDDKIEYITEVSVVDPTIGTSDNDGFTEVNAAGKEMAPTSQDSGIKSTLISNSFSVLNLDEGDCQHPKSGMKNDGSEHIGNDHLNVDKEKAQEPSSLNAGSNEVLKEKNVRSFVNAFSTRGCINESDTDDDNAFTSYGSSLGGGNQLEDVNFEFSDGYED